MNWYIGVLKKYAVFSGRARRKEYWMFVLVNCIIAFALGFIEGSLGGPGVFVQLYNLAVIIPSLAVGVRRMHDTDHSGWWLLVPFVNFYFAVIPGSQGENRFGADPIEPAQP